MTAGRPRSCSRDVPERRELGRKVVGDELEDPLWARAARGTRTRRARARSRRDRGTRLLRDEYLATVPGLADARGAVDVEADEAVAGALGLADVEADAYADAFPAGHGVRAKARCISIAATRPPAGIVEDAEELVAAAVHLVAARALDRASLQLAASASTAA